MNESSQIRRNCHRGQKSVPNLIAEWVAGQPFTNALLVAILLGVGWMGWFTVTVAIPKHLEAIQSGYEKLDVINRDERTQIRMQHEKWLDKVIDLNRQAQ